MLRKIECLCFIVALILTLYFNTNTCYAASFQDLVEYSQHVKNNESPSSWALYAINFVIDKQTQIQQKINVAEYNNFIAICHTGSNGYVDSIAFCANNGTMNLASNRIDNVTKFTYTLSNASFSSVTTGNLTWSSSGSRYNPSMSISLTDAGSISNDYVWTTKRWCYCNIFNTNISTIPQYIGDLRIASYYYNSTYKPYLYGENGQYIEIDYNEETVNNGTLYQLILRNSQIEEIDTNYKYMIVYGEENNPVYQDGQYRTYEITLPEEPTQNTNGTITTHSGDSGEIYQIIDYTPIVQTIESGNKEIVENIQQGTNSIVNAIESGEKETQNFIQQKVNEIFGVNSGDLNESLDKFIENINLPSGELEIDKTILGIITQDAGDFVISWQTVETPFLTISGDSINFSALCRSNEELAKLKEWLNIILSLFCFGALLTNFWNSLLLTLGISTYIYEKQSTELEKAAKQEARKQIRLEKEHEKGYQAFKRRNGK